MTNHEKKQYLKKYIPAISQLELMQAKREKVCSISSQKITDMPICHGSTADKLADTIIELVNMEDRFFEKNLAEYQNIISNVLTAIYGLVDLTEQQIMSLRYIHGMHWPDIFIKMGYCEKQVHRYHAKALNNIVIAEKEDSK